MSELSWYWRDAELCWNRKYRTEAHKQNELSAVMATAIQFGLKHFDIYGIRSDRDKLKKKFMFLDIVFPPDTITK